ncbi:MAG: c-type cytochrome, partial [Planctomycetota bacterium]|nr:c-type cytochrome [Planctomycetota bacterium]
MRSSDKTYYSIKRLHLVFAVSAAVLVGTTVWMIAVDHNRPWKAYQRTFRDRVEPWWAGPQAAEQPSALAKWLARLPFVEAHARWLAVQQIWLPELTIDYNFRRVARFDRCTTCHLGIERGGGSVPGFGRAERLTVELATPPGPPGGGPTTESLYGFSLAPRGILDANVPTVSAVGDATAAARAGLYPGDGILRIGGQPVADRDAAAGRLSSGLVWGEPLNLEIERGLPQPYSGHPRIDLFVGGDSPHPAAEFGCTICHAGQGSATQFALASHSPNTTQQTAFWRARHDWSRNEHWDFPMLPARFLESSCLKCHHDVVDLEASERFLTPPAPKLLAGYHLVRQHGCFGCHEISGVDAAGRSIGPDMRLEPAAIEQSEPLKPGTMRKVGPSLRHAAERLSADALATWIADPSRLRSSTRMPRLFGLHEHLEGDEAATARRLEAVEVRAIASYLLAASQPVDPPPSASGVTEPPSAVRGRELLVRRGCAACHRHQDVPEATSTVGADLSGLASIFSTAAEKWLAGWIRDPAHYWPRTRMPNPLLAPEPVDGETPDGRPRMSDPAADLAAYLLASPGERLAAPPPLVTADLDALARSHLARQFTDKEADSLLAGGVAAAH